jgi:hypothetical protein
LAQGVVRDIKAGCDVVAIVEQIEGVNEKRRVH